MRLKMGSLFDGIAGFPLAGSRHGIEPVWASEIEPAPITVSRRHFPTMKHLGDVTKINGAEIEPVDVLTFGSPCFPAGTLVLTAKGYVPIEEVSVGDLVLTHTGRWQKVLRTGGKMADTIILKGFGHPGLETTHEHPFYGSSKGKKWRNHPTRGWDAVMSAPEWIEAQNMRGKFWATPIVADSLPVPPIIPGKHKGAAAPVPSLDTDFWWFVGRWLGDGWLRNGMRVGRPGGWGQIFICCAHDEAELVKEHLGRLGLQWADFAERTVTKFRTTNQALTLWLLEHFGQYAHAKAVPAWVLSLPKDHRRALLDGYFGADGWERPNGSLTADTISKTLALGIRLVAESLGYASPLYFSEVKPTTTIEGRVVRQRNRYTVRCAQNERRTSRIEAHGHSWGLVRSITEGRREVPVFNLEVEGDNSYVVENIVVHNCTDLSVAGKREGLGDDLTKTRHYRVKGAPEGWKRQRSVAETRVYTVDLVLSNRRGTRSGLFYHAVRIIREMQEATKNGPEGPKPSIAVWENVPGAFSSNTGRDFAAVLESLVGGPVDVPRGGWTRAGVAFGPLGQVAWRTFDAQYWGVPQRRRRIYLVADFRGERAGQILFEPKSMSGDSQTGREAGKGSAGSPSGSPGASGGFALIGNAEYRAGRVGTIRAEGGDCGGVARPSSSLEVDGRQEELVPPVDQCLLARTGRRGDAETETFIPVPVPTPPQGPKCFYESGQGWFTEGVGVLRAQGGGTPPNTVVEPFVAIPTPPQEPWIAATLMASGAGVNRPADMASETDFLVPMTQSLAFALRGREDGAVPEVHGDGDTTGALRAAGGGSSRDYVAQPIAFENRYDEGVRLMGDTCNTLRGKETGGGHHDFMIAQPTTFAVKTNQTGANGGNVAEESAFSLNATDKQAVAMCYDAKDLGRRPAEFTEQAPTLKARAGTGGGNVPVTLQTVSHRLR